MPVSTNKPLRFRQIHLDFHTSEHIPGIGAAFDPKEFVGTLRDAAVNSITIFAKCHHGWSYYPTKVGAPHPQLARPDLMGDMVRALNAAVGQPTRQDGATQAAEDVDHARRRASQRV